MSDVSPTGAPGGMPYKPQYQISSGARHFWEKLFHGQPLSDKEVSQMNDQFIKSVWNNMNQVLKWALAQQKKRDREQRQQRNG